jgi:hypothetical protein
LRVLKVNFPDSAFLVEGGRKSEKPWYQLW